MVEAADAAAAVAAVVAAIAAAAIASGAVELPEAAPVGVPVSVVATVIATATGVGVVEDGAVCGVEPAESVVDPSLVDDVASDLVSSEFEALDLDWERCGAPLLALLLLSAFAGGGPALF